MANQQKNNKSRKEKENFSIVAKIFLKHLRKNNLKNSEIKSKDQDVDKLRKLEQEFNK